ncbi:MAG: LytR C-terminal domain-containing protein [Candidatus Levybacteria bacterium]|nr:LytR C-terminal domain-containing protein [Candidatus Levybacteria bacterium]
MVFLAIVFLLSALSLGVKLFRLIQASSYDGSHRFIVSVVDAKKHIWIASLAPSEKALLLSLKQADSKQDIASRLLIPINGTILLQQEADTSSLSTLFATALFDPQTRYENMTVYDMFRLYLDALRIASKDTTVASYTFSEDVNTISDALRRLFVDSKLVANDQTIAIENGSGTSGIGQRLERIVTLLGGNVVSVTTARATQQPTYIYYSGEKTYTTKRLERLLKQQAEVGDTKIADILVVVGVRSLQLDIFATI